MKSQPNRNYQSNDDVQTPLPLAKRVVTHFLPYPWKSYWTDPPQCLEPCRGDGNIYRYLPKGSKWCEIKRGVDFLKFKGNVDWIITNPPWSQIRDFLIKSMSVSQNVVFLMTVNHLWTKARVRDVREAGFGLKEIALCDMPKEFPPSGFQLAAIHLQKGYKGATKISSLS